MSIRKKLIFVFVVVISSAKVWGQAARSPFTTFGIGQPYGNSLIQNQGMGGIGVAVPQFWYLNNQNPALLVYNGFTVFQAGVVLESRELRSDTLNERSVNGNLNYLATAFPIKPGKWTTSVGLMPFTNVNYEFQYFDYVLDGNNARIDTVIVTESGTGGLTQLYWSNGVRITPDLNVGLKATYVFGPIEKIYSNVVTNSNQAVPFQINVREKTNVKDFLFGLGLSYGKDSLGRKNDYRVTLGAVYNFATKLKSNHRTELSRGFNIDSPIDVDTVSSSSGKIELPSSLSVGFSVAKGTRWSIGTEFNYQDWSSFRSISQDSEGLGKSWRAALGGELTPDPFASENYFKRITYRTGVSYEQYPFYANDKQVKDFGINFGISLPAGRSSLDFAFKVGKQGNRSENLLQENYFKVYFGLTFNDQWFIKRRFD